MKFSKNFERDWEWYFKYRKHFIFDGSFPKEIEEDIVNGKTAKECFYIFDTHGKLVPTKELELLHEIFKCKGSINFMIKEWAQDRNKGYLPLVEFSKRLCKEYYNTPDEFLGEHTDIETEFELLEWMVIAVENQKNKYL